MLKLVLALLVAALPMAASAAEEIGSTHSPRLAPKSWQNSSDIFHNLAHACFSGVTSCGPDNTVNSPFYLYIDFEAPVTQVYTRYWIVTDVEGNVVFIDQNTTVKPGGTNTIFFGPIFLPGSGNVASRGVYRFLSLIIGADGKIAFSDYYRFRVLP